MLNRAYTNFQLDALFVASTCWELHTLLKTAENFSDHLR